MNTPHLFVWSGGVINLEKITVAVMEEEGACLKVHCDGGLVVTLQGDPVGEFMLQCAQYHIGDRRELARRLMAAESVAARATPPTAAPSGGEAQ